jgi:hypothetical protein
VPIEVVIRGLTGELHNVTEKWAIPSRSSCGTLRAKTKSLLSVSSRQDRKRAHWRRGGADRIRSVEVLEVRKALDL